MQTPSPVNLSASPPVPIIEKANLFFVIVDESLSGPFSVKLEELSSKEGAVHQIVSEHESASGQIISYRENIEQRVLRKRSKIVETRSFC